MRLLLGALLVILAAGCGSTKKSLGEPPQKIVAGFYSCPAEAPTLAVRHFFYPATYPRRPPASVRPSRCFRTSEQATLAGLRRAPTPAGDVRLDDLYLVPARGSLGPYCRASAARAALPAPCPTLVPAPNTSVEDCGGAAPCASRGRFVLEGNFAGPPGYVGAGQGAGHLWFLATSRAQRAAGECSSPRHLAGRVEIFGASAHWLACPPGSELNSGHVLLMWRSHGVNYAVSVHGVTSLNRRLALLLARHLRFVRW
jgi:hypothetical protein